MTIQEQYKQSHKEIDYLLSRLRSKLNDHKSEFARGLQNENSLEDLTKIKVQLKKLLK